MAVTCPVEHVAEQFKVGNFCDSCLSALTNLLIQLGENVHTSMVSACLKDLEALGKKGIDIKIITNTAGNIHAGMSCFITTPSPPYHNVKQCQTPWVSQLLLRADHSHSLSD